jgi:hypothetical protein
MFDAVNGVSSVLHTDQVPLLLRFKDKEQVGMEAS